MDTRTTENALAIQQWEYTSQYLPGGVSASARLNKALGGPFYASRGEGAYVYDLEGRRYVDMHNSFGAALLGHGHPAIRRAVTKAADLGILCAHETVHHAEAARRLVEVLPCADMVRFSGSGTETTYYAIKLAREFTGREKVIKFEGHFHGFHDYLQYNCWPPIGEGLPAIRPEAAGVPEGAQKYVIVLPWNDVEAFAGVVRERGDEIAAAIMEPINYNSGGILPRPGYLEAVREITERAGIVLIFDEILSGFRTGPGCAQEYLGITPDLCTVGKALGGGLPISAFGGRRAIMEHVAPLGHAQHSGTYNAPLVCVLAAKAFLEEITRADFYPTLLSRCERFYTELRQIIARSGVRCWLQATGARFNLLFGLDREPQTYLEAARRDVDMTNRFFAAALRHGVYFYTGWHHGLSIAHDDEAINTALEGIEAALKETRY
jgi:glutamate-1-semialdehyde 2,1-aminomutase